MGTWSKKALNPSYKGFNPGSTSQINILSTRSLVLGFLFFTFSCQKFYPRAGKPFQKYLIETNSMQQKGIVGRKWHFQGTNSLYWNIFGWLLLTSSETYLDYYMHKFLTSLTQRERKKNKKGKTEWKKNPLGCHWCQQYTLLMNTACWNKFCLWFAMHGSVFLSF